MMRAWRNSLMSRQVRFQETFAIADPMVVWVATAVVVMAMLCSASGVVRADQPPEANRGAAKQESGPVATYGDDRFRFGRSVRSLCFSPDGKELVSHGHSWGPVLWDARTGKLIRQFPSEMGHFEVSPRACFSPDGELLVAGNVDVRVWNVASGELLYRLENAGRLVDFTQGGKHFLAYARDGAAALVETKTGKRVYQFPKADSPHSRRVAALSPDGSRAIIVNDGIARRWDLTSGEEILPRLRKDHLGAYLNSIRFTPDGRSLVAITGEASFSLKLQLFDSQTLKFQREFSFHGSLRSFEVSRDGRLLAIGTDNTRNYSIQLFDLAQGKLVRRWPAGISRAGHGLIMTFSPDAKTIASTVENTPAVRLWDVATGKEKFPHSEGGATTLQRMTVLPDGQTLVTQDYEKRVIRRDLKTGRIIRRDVWTNSGLFQAMCPKTGALLSSDLKAMGNTDSLKDSQLTADVTKHRHTMSAACFSADGNRVAVLFRPSRLNVYDRHSGKRLRQLGPAPPENIIPNYISDLASSADGKRVAFWHGGETHVWNVETGQKLKAAPWGGYDFAPDGTLVITKDQEIRLWNVDEGKLIGTLDDEPHEIGAVAFSSDGKLMAHARRSGKDEVVLWDLPARRVIRVLRGARGGAAVLAFSPDGGKLYAGTGSSLIVGWDLHAKPAVKKVKPAEVQSGSDARSVTDAGIRISHYGIRIQIRPATVTRRRKRRRSGNANQNPLQNGVRTTLVHTLQRQTKHFSTRRTSRQPLMNSGKLSNIRSFHLTRSRSKNG